MHCLPYEKNADKIKNIFIKFSSSQTANTVLGFDLKKKNKKKTGNSLQMIEEVEVSQNTLDGKNKRKRNPPPKKKQPKKRNILVFGFCESPNQKEKNPKHLRSKSTRILGGKDESNVFHFCSKTILIS